MDSDITFITKNPAETETLGKKIASDLVLVKSQKQRVNVFYLYGMLGSGKTTFAKGFARGLGIKARIISPTFIIMKNYPLSDKKQQFCHIDLYRVNNAVSGESIGLNEILKDKNNIVLMEWAENCSYKNFSPRTDISFKELPDASHEIRIRKIKK